MSFQLASAYVQLGQRGFTGVMGGINAIGARLTSLGPITSNVTGSMGASMMALGPVVGGIAAGVAGVGVAAYGAASAFSDMIDKAVNLEQVETRFKTLLGSTEAAKRMIADLSQFAASTPFQMEGLTRASQTLLAFGVAQDQILPTMQALGDVAAASGADINELGNIYGKVKARGALMTESLDQFNERAIPVGASLAKLFNKTEAEIRQMASRGEISFGDLQRAMVDMTREGGMAFGGMQSQSQTLGGLWSTLSDNISLAMTDIGGALVEGFELKSISATIIDFTDKVRGEWLPSIVGGFKWLSGQIVQPMAVGFGMVTGIVGDFISNTDLYWQIASLHVSNFALDSFERIRTFFVNILEVAGWAWTNWDKALGVTRDNTLALFDNITENLTRAWQAFLDFVAGGEFAPNFKPMLDGIKTVYDVIPELSKPALGQLNNDIAKAYAELGKRQAAAAAKGTAGGAARTALNIDGTPLGDGEGGGGGGGGGGSPNAGGSRNASFVGIAQLAEMMQAQAGAQQDMKRQVAAAEAGAAGINKVASKAESDGLRVNVVGWNVGGGAPEVSHAFGS